MQETVLSAALSSVIADLVSSIDDADDDDKDDDDNDEDDILKKYDKACSVGGKTWTFIEDLEKDNKLSYIKATHTTVKLLESDPVESWEVAKLSSFLPLSVCIGLGLGLGLLTFELETNPKE